MSVIDPASPAAEERDAPAGPAAPRPARRRSRKLLAWLLAGAVTFVGWNELRKVTAPPPDVGNFGRTPTGEGVVDVSLPAGSQYLVPLRDGGAYSFGFSVSNRSDFDVEITGFPLELYFARVEVWLGGGNLDARGANWWVVRELPERPFAPFTLRPGEQRMVTFRLDVDPTCTVEPPPDPFLDIEPGRVSANGGSSLIEDVPVEFRVGFYDRSAQIPVTPIAFVGHPQRCDIDRPDPRR